MNRSTSLASTFIPALTLVLGILIGWRLGPDTVQEVPSDSLSRVSGVVPGVEGGVFTRDPATGDAALISSLPVAPESRVGSQTLETGSSTEDAIQYFPESVAGEDSSASDAADASRPENTARLVSRRADESFDEETWRSELAGLTDEQADEVINIRRQLGAVAAQSLGVTTPVFPDLPDTAGIKAPPSAEPGRFPVSADSGMRPAVALADSGQPPSAGHVSEGAVRSVQATGFLPDQFLVSSEKDPLKPSGLTGAVRPANAVVERFRDAVRRAQLLNLRNQMTPGYKRSELVVVNAAVGAGVAVVSGTATGANDGTPASDDRGVELVTWLERIDTQQGELVETANPFDVAIDGSGWLQVEHDGRQLLTRAGILCLTDSEQLGIRTQLGPLPLVPVIEFSELPSGKLVIAEDGTVFSGSQGSAEDAVETNPAKITVVDVPNAAALNRVDGGLFEVTPATGQPFETRRVRLRQGQLEQSNVAPESEGTEAEALLRLADILSGTVD